MSGEQRKVFNVGFSKTGTTSLERAFKLLGYRVSKGHWKYHYNYYLLALAVNRDYDEIIRYAQYFDAFCDGPWGGGTDLYKHLAEAYPDAHFLLSVRDPDKWYASLVTMLSMFDEDDRKALSSYHRHGFFGTVYWFRKIFDIEELHGNRDKIIAKYLAYNQEVQDHFRALGRPLYVVDISKQEHPWEGLCGFLGKDVPNKAFPRLNTAPKDKAKVQQSLREQVAAALDLNFLLGD